MFEVSPNSDDFKHARLGAFSSEAPPNNQAHIIIAQYVQPIVRWVNYSSYLPRLQSLAFRLLSQPELSSCRERNCNHYDDIQTVKRNKLISKRAKDLDSCHNKPRVMARKENS